jgi:hypothetical protein
MGGIHGAIHIHVTVESACRAPFRAPLTHDASALKALKAYATHTFTSLAFARHCNAIPACTYQFGCHVHFSFIG